MTGARPPKAERAPECNRDDLNSVASIIPTATPATPCEPRPGCNAGRSPERDAFLIVLRPERDCGDQNRALRRLLKFALRSLRLRCVGIEQIAPENGA